MAFIDQLFSGNIVTALCWMLVHSLWIGLVLTVVTGIIMLCTKKQSAAIRYNLLIASFFVFTIAMITVLFVQLGNISSTDGQPVASANEQTININNNTPAFQLVENKSSFTAPVVDFFNNYATMIVMLWLLIITFRCIKLAAGLKKVKQLKSTHLSSVGEVWNEKLVALSHRLNIKGNIQFFQSAIAEIPMVVGHLKPIILFPAGILASLPPQEIEAILIHELAHIRRKDYLVNMLQNFVEILFFFNPAVLWVSSLIKIERENCCDDIAVAESSSKRNYINALVSFQEYHLGAGNYATAFAGNKEQLLQRVKRMLYNNNKTLNGMEKTFLIVCLVVTSSLMMFFTSRPTTANNTLIAAANQGTVPSLANRIFNAADFKEGSTSTYSEKVNGVSHTVRIYKRNGVLYEIYGDITSFKIDGVAIPKAEWGKYKELIAQLRSEHKNAQTAITDQTNQTQKTETATTALAPLEEKLEPMERSLAEQNKLKAEQDSKIYKLQEQKYELDKQRTETTHKREIVRTVTDGAAVISKSVLKYSENNYPPNNAVVNNYKPYTPANTEDKKNSYIITGIQSDGTSKAKNVDIQELTNNVIADLTKEKIITNSAVLSYKLSNEVLIVNDKIQPEAIHQKLKEKYIKSADWKLLYNWRN